MRPYNEAVTPEETVRLSNVSLVVGPREKRSKYALANERMQQVEHAVPLSTRERPFQTFSKRIGRELLRQYGGEYKPRGNCGLRPWFGDDGPEDRETLRLIDKQQEVVDGKRAAEKPRAIDVYPWAGRHAADCVPPGSGDVISDPRPRRSGPPGSRVVMIDHAPPPPAAKPPAGGKPAQAAKGA